MKKLIIYILLFTGLLLGTSLQNELVAKNNTRPNIPFIGGIEVNSYSGMLHYRRYDFNLSNGSFNLFVAFFYNRSQTQDYGFGHGWTFKQNLFYRKDSSDMWIHHGEGKQDLYVTQNGAYYPPTGVFDCFEQYGPGKYRLMKKSGLIYLFEDSTHQKVTRIVSPNGREITFSYQNGELQQIINQVGLTINMTWQNDHLAEITENNGSQTRKWEYIYDSKGYLVSVKNALGQTIQYSYDKEGRLNKIVQEDGNTLLIGYDNANAIQELSSCDKHFYFTYDIRGRKTYAIEEGETENVVTVYEYDMHGNLVRKRGSCCGYNMSFGYDADLNMTKRVDGNGNVTLMAYDADGNMLSETDPLGNTQFFTYVQGTSWLSQKIDKLGRITNFVRDSVGNITEVIHPMGKVERYAYDSRSNRIRYTDGKGKSYHYQYDSLDQLILVKAPLGLEIRMNNDKRGNLISETTAEGHLYQYRYDIRDRKIAEIDPLGYERRFFYNSRGLLEKIINARGDSTVHVFDGNGRRIMEIMPESTTKLYKHDRRGNRIAITDPNGNITQFQYNRRDLKVAEIDPYGNTTRFEYDGVGNLIRIIDPAGNVTTRTYDPLNRLIRETNALGYSNELTYDAEGQLISTFDARGNTRQYAYDQLGRQISETDPLGNTTTYQYDMNDLLTVAIDPLGRVSQTIYDSLDRPIIQINALGDSTKMAYDKEGHIIRYDNELGKITQFEYNELGWQTQEIDPNGRIQMYTYDEEGNIISSRTNKGNVFWYTYDGLGREIEQRDSLGLIVRQEFDKNGNLVRLMDTLGRMTVLEYDHMDRLTKVTDPLGNEERFIYNRLGQHTGHIDQNNKMITYSYDLAGQVIGKTNSLGHTTSFEYSPLGKITKMTDALNRSTLFNYDPRGLLISKVFPDNSQISFNHDAVGNVIQKTDRKGISTRYIHDALNRVVMRDYPGTNQDVDISYDAQSNITGLNSLHASISYTYDNTNRPETEVCNGRTLSRRYLQFDEILETTYPSGRVINEQFDLRERLINVSEGTSNLASFTFGLNDRVSEFLYGNGITTQVQYDPLERQTRIKANNGVIGDWNYTYDPKGIIRRAEPLHRPQQASLFSYDVDDRLTGVKKGPLQAGQIPNPTSTQNFSLDALGNRVSESLDTTSYTYQVDSRNAYLSRDTQQFNYDLNGNLLQDGNHSYQYDFENRLISVDQGTTARFAYDPLGRRIQKIVGQDTFVYVYDDFRVIESYRNGVLEASFVYGEEYDDIIQMKRGAQEYYYHQTLTKSVYALSNSLGQVVERYDYDVFGTPTISDANYQTRTSSQVGNPYYFTGRRFDEESKLYYFRNRMYQPVLGRFLQQDPTGYADGPNMYIYAHNSPLNYTDPMGLHKIKGSSWKSRIKDFIPTKISDTYEILNLNVPLIPAIPMPWGGLFSVNFNLSLAGVLCCNESLGRRSLEIWVVAKVEVSFQFGLGTDVLGEFVSVADLNNELKQKSKDRQRKVDIKKYEKNEELKKKPPVRQKRLGRRKGNGQERSNRNRGLTTPPKVRDIDKPWCYGCEDIPKTSYTEGDLSHKCKGRDGSGTVGIKGGAKAGFFATAEFTIEGVAPWDQPFNMEWKTGYTFGVDFYIGIEAFISFNGTSNSSWVIY